MVSRKNIPDPSHLVPTHMEVVGIDAIVKTIEYFFLAIPDLTVKPLSERIHVYANGESCVECNYQVNGTKILEIRGCPEGSNDKLVVKSEVNELIAKIGSMNANAKIVVNVEKDGDTINKIPMGIGAATQSKYFTTPYTLSMHLNVNKKVFLIIFATD